MKKTTKKLAVTKETIRVLSNDELSQVAGGIYVTTAVACAGGPKTTAINCTNSPGTTAIICK